MMIFSEKVSQLALDLYDGWLEVFSAPRPLGEHFSIITYVYSTVYVLVKEEISTFNRS